MTGIAPETFSTVAALSLGRLHEPLNATAGE